MSLQCGSYCQTADRNCKFVTYPCMQVGSAPVSKNSTTSLSATISHNFKTEVTTLQMGAGVQNSRKRFSRVCGWH